MSLLAGQTAVITGGAQGLGFAIAEQFIAEGARVVLGDLNLDAAAVTPQLRAAGLTPVEAGFTSPRDAPREQIDWVAASEDLAVVDAGVGRASVSDHLPLFASLSVREPGEFR